MGFELLGRQRTFPHSILVLASQSLEERDSGQSRVPPPHNNAKKLGGLNTLLIQIFSR